MLETWVLVHGSVVLDRVPAYNCVDAVVRFMNRGNLTLDCDVLTEADLLYERQLGIKRFELSLN